MKKLGILMLMLVLVSASAFAVLTYFNVVWSGDVTGLTGSTSCGTYNWDTGHFLYCDYSAAAVRIGSGTDGSLTGSSLDTTGITFGGLGVFAICATSDGVIYGGTNPDFGGGETTALVRWASESDTSPTEQEPTQTAGQMAFPRAMDAVGTGADTVIGVTGGSTLNATILTTSDGTNFEVTDVTADATLLADTEQIKQGIALVAGNPEKVYGTKADGAGQVVCLVKSGGTWASDPGFTPPNSYTAVPDGLDAAAPIGYMPQHNAVVVLGCIDTTEDTFSVLNGTTGSVMFQVASGVNVGAFGYGAIDLDEDQGKGFFAARNLGGGQCAGELAFDVYVVPTAANSSWGLYE